MLYQSSRRTIMDGEVVTFATGFRKLVGLGYHPTGPFEVSASRNAVVVDTATITNPQQLAAFIHAVEVAYAAMERIPEQAGAASVFPSEPTEVPHDNRRPTRQEGKQ
jgi:hypothetical protein